MCRKKILGGLRFRWDYLVVALKSVTHPSETNSEQEWSDLLLTSELNKVFSSLKH